MVWAQQAPAPRRHHRQQQQQQQQQIEMVYKGVEKWITDEHCTTVLCRPSGQVHTHSAVMMITITMMMNIDDD